MFIATILYITHISPKIASCSLHAITWFKYLPNRHTRSVYWNVRSPTVRQYNNTSSMMAFIINIKSLCDDHRNRQMMMVISILFSERMQLSTGFYGWDDIYRGDDPHWWLVVDSFRRVNKLLHYIEHVERREAWEDGNIWPSSIILPAGALRTKSKEFNCQCLAIVRRAWSVSSSDRQLCLSTLSRLSLNDHINMWRYRATASFSCDNDSDLTLIEVDIH